MRHKFISFFLAAWILFTMPMTTFAQELDPAQTGTVSISLTDQSNKMPICGVEFSLYQVASAKLDESGDLKYIYTDEFKALDVSPDDPAVVAEVEAYIREYSVSSEKNVTDSQGRAVFSDLPQGLYFLKQTKVADGYAACKSFMVSVPEQTDNNYSYDVKAIPKTEKEKFIDITIRKVWDVDDTADIADHVSVELLRDGSVVKTAVLDERNNWEIRYYDMPESDSYSIVEQNIPEGFIASYTRRGYEFTVTNKLAPVIGNGAGGEGGAGGENSNIGDIPTGVKGDDFSVLMQTGQIVWPIPVLAMAGVCLIAVGTIILRKTGDNNA